MFQRYATGELVLMDATYKMTRYAIPLSLVRVHTNVGYKVVAEFMCQDETQRGINVLHVRCTFAISIDYKQCTVGQSQRRMAFPLMSKRYS
ncbi:unnamed protein product [Pocillopora meandrina]|uniref:Uncharacterized protein n=1 Tax=Pocillopora meandrina TaxID=46732 RepID=A0AAU9VXA3_9CNID|nr:unnamed protein product [Pocillopora meandrina]